MTKSFTLALLLSVPILTAFPVVVRAQTTPKPTLPPLYYDWDAKQDKVVNDAVVRAVRVGDKLEVTSKSPNRWFYFRVVPPLSGYDEQVATKVLSPGQQFRIPDRHGSIRFDVGNFEFQGLRVSYYSEFNRRSSGDIKPHISKGNFLIRFKSADSDKPETPDPYAIDAKEDKYVNDAVTSAVRVGDKLEIQSETPSFLFWFGAVPVEYETFTKPRPYKTVSPGQEFVLRDHHGTINYKVMEFQTDGLLIRYNSLFNVTRTPHISSGSFVVRFKSPAELPTTKAK